MRVDEHGRLQGRCILSEKVFGSGDSATRAQHVASPHRGCSYNSVVSIREKLLHKVHTSQSANARIRTHERSGVEFCGKPRYHGPRLSIDK